MPFLTLRTQAETQYRLEAVLLKCGLEAVSWKCGLETVTRRRPGLETVQRGPGLEAAQQLEDGKALQVRFRM